MRILHCVPSYLPAWRYGGPIRSVHGLARAQAAAGHAVEVFTTDADGSGRLDVPNDRPVDRDGVAVHYFRLGVPARIYRSPAMRRALAERVGEFDVVHLHSVFLWPTLAGARAARQAGVSYVVSPRGMLVDELIRRRGALRKRLWIRLFDRRTLGEAAAIHLTSAAERREFERLGLALAPLYVVPNGVNPSGDDEPVDAAMLARVDAATAGGDYLLFLGRLDVKKRLPLLLEAVSRVDGLRLVVAGNDETGLRSALERRAAELGLAARVAWAGEVRGAAKSRLLAGARALALLSTSENFGNVVLESLAQARPVLVTRGVGVADLVEESGSGWIVDADPAAVAAALRELLANPAAADEMGRRGRSFVERDLGWEKMAERMDEVYRAARAGRARGD